MSKQRSIGLIMVALLLGILMASMDNMIVATAMGSIVADLGGLDKYVWATSAFMVMEMAGMPIFGKLSDMFGRKRFFVFGLIVFMVGSALCGIASNIVELSIFRAIQGIGGGALVPIAFTIIFDVYPPEKRGQMSGIFGAVFGVSSLFGPLLGAYITDYLSWEWIFYINLPLGILALIFILVGYKESPMHTKQSIDWLGAGTLVGAVISVMFALELGGDQYAWDSTQIIAMFTAAAVLFVAFIFAERRAEAPIINFKMFRERLYLTSTVAGAFYNIGFVVAVVFIPLFVQGVYGGKATNSGLILLPMTVASVVAAASGGNLANKFSYRALMRTSSIIFLTGMICLSTINPDTPHYLLTIYMIITGFGIGFSFSVLGMSGIHHFDARQRGQASSTISFVREFGMTVGITIFGILQRNIFGEDMKKMFSGASSDGHADLLKDPRAILSPEMRKMIPKDILHKITDTLATSIGHTLQWAIIPAALTVITLIFMSGERLRDAKEINAGGGGH
jgi:EmrB/QacA subfamily drug resistance transporter